MATQSARRKVAMRVSYWLGRTVGRHKLATAIVLGAAAVLLQRSCSASAQAEADKIHEAEEAGRVAVIAKAEALKQRCSTGYPAVLSEAKAAQVKGDSRAALALLTPCNDSSAGLENKAFYSQLVSAVDLADKKKLATEKIEVARAEKAEKALKKKEGVRIGMSKQDVLDSSWGRPDHVNTTTTAAGSREQWVYGLQNYLYFVDETLTTIQN